MTRRVRLGMIVGIVVATIGVAAIVALPVAARWLIARQVETVTGRPATIEDVDLNVFTRHLIVRELRVAADQGPPLAELSTLDVRFRLWPLLRGRIAVDSVRAHAPVVRLRRDDAGRLNVEDIIERLLARPKAEPLSFHVDRLTVENGRVHFADRAPEPAVTWTVTAFAVSLHGVGTETSGGRASLSFSTGGGADGHVELSAIGVRPLTAAFDIRLEGFDVATLRPYFAPDAALVVAGGSVTARASGRYRADEGLSTTVEGRAADVILVRRGHDVPVVTVPAMTLMAGSLVWRDGIARAERIEINAAPATVALRGDRAPTLMVTPLQLVVTDASFAGGPPAQVTLTAGLEDGGALDARGTAVLAPLSVDLSVAVRDVQLALVRPFLPADAFVAPRGGSVRGDLKARFTDAVLVVSGDVRVTDVLLTRRGQAEPFVRDTSLAATIRDFTVRDGTLAAGEITVRGSPTVVDVSGGSPQRFRFTRFSARVRDAAWPASKPARVAIQAAVEGGGTSALSGTAHPATLAADIRAEFTDVDLTRFTPYLPDDAPVALGGGRANATVTMTHARERGVEIDGTAIVENLVLLRRGQADAFVTDPSLEVRVDDLIVKDRVVRVARATIEGTPRVIERSGRTPQQFDFASLGVVVRDAHWPGPSTARIDAHGTLADGAASSLEGTVTLPDLAASARATFRGLDLARANVYLPAGTPVTVTHGRLDATIDMQYTRTVGVRLAGDLAAIEVALLRDGEREPFFTDERITATVSGLTIGDEAVTVARAVLDGSPTITPGATTPARRLTVPSMRITATEFGWPGDGPGRLEARLELPDDGELTATATVRTAGREIDGVVSIRNAAVAPFTAFVPIDAPLRGRVEGEFQVRATLGDERRASTTGTLHVRDVEVGPSRRPPIRIARASALGLDLAWPLRVRIERLEIEAPSVLVERAPDGSFPLRAMLTPAPSSSSASAASAVSPAAASDPGPGDPNPRVLLTIDTLVVAGGDIRFVDRTTRPTYSEEMTQLDLTVQDLTTGPAPAALALNGAVGGNAAVALEGVVAPFARPFVLDVSGTLRNFPVPRTNPYLQKFLEWIATRGEATTRVHYRIVGDRLEATNEVVVERLDLEPASTTPDRLVGLPLGLVVSLLKNSRGEIRLTVPVSGELGSPKFSFGDAIGTAFRNVVTRLVTAPLNLIGRVFRSGDDDDRTEVAIDPVVFVPGSTVLTPEGAKQIQRVADFLRSSPHVRVGVRPVVGAQDVAALEEPPNPAARPRAPQTVAQLVERRIEATRRALVRAAGVEPDRVVPIGEEPAPQVEGRGRVEFTLL